MQFIHWFQSRYGSFSPRSIEAVVKLAAEGATIPFIARYRKEQTGNLDEVAIQTILDADETWQALLKRQEFVVAEIERQEKLTPELKEKILSTYDPATLEDLYLPYKQKRKTRATKAKEAGLEPLADWVFALGQGSQQLSENETLESKAAQFLNPEKGIQDASQALLGAQDILVERLAEKQDLRAFVRQQLFQEGFVVTGKGVKPKNNSKYESYFNYHEKVFSLLKPQHSHRYLAARRGWIEEELTLTFGGKPDAEGGDSGFFARLLKVFEESASAQTDSLAAEVLKKVAHLALKAHVLPSIESEVHRALKTVADEMAIEVFAGNLKKLLLASPLGAQAILGVDPGIRTGCKVAVVDDSGKFLSHTVFSFQTEEEKANAKKLLTEIASQGLIRAVAVGNGTYGRETELFIRLTFKEGGFEAIPVVMVNEAGASVYSASEIAREEFPELDVTVRGAISIARRLQDPLAELVKIDPKSIGVGQYQHDVSQPLLKKSLNHVVENCVNQVGVNLNTASQALLAYVAGIGPALAKGIVEYRAEKGLFNSRTQLLDVPYFTQKTFEQAAGFLRIPNALHPLDNTGVHPERYPLIEAKASQLSKSVQELMGEGVQVIKADESFKTEVGQFTFEDIIRELEKPGRDPRNHFVPFHYRDDVHELKDLVPGMVCPGLVTNVTNFGAFVDLGVHQDGLVHLSQLSHRYVRDPHEVVSPGDRVLAKVLEVNIEKKQISLSLRLEERPPKRVAEHQVEKKTFEPRKPITSQESRRNSEKSGERPTQAPRREEIGRQFARSPNTSSQDRRSRSEGAKKPNPKNQGAIGNKPSKSMGYNPFGALAALRDQLKEK